VTRQLLCALLLALPAAAGQAVTAHGIVLEGDVAVDGDEIVVTRGRRVDRFAKAEVLLCEEDGGHLLFAPDFGSRMRGYEYLARAERVSLAADLAGDAVRARDASLARRLLDLAEADGFTGRDAEKLKKRVENLEARSATPDAKKAEAVASRLGELGAIYADLLVARARADEAGGLRLLREALRIAPAHAGAQALLAERAPKDFALGPPDLWLRWHLDLESRGARLLGDDVEDVARMRREWRKDLYGIEAGQIRIVTPVLDTATVGRCLAHGQLVCAALAEIFRTDEPKPRMTQTLLVLLYPDMKEYLEKSVTRGTEEDRAFLETTGGHYAPAEQLSRVVWDRDPDAERRIARVFVHELTHHWITELNPRYSNAELRLMPTVPGYWIVEGFAMFLEEGVFDADRGTWSAFDGRAASLDSVQALAKAGRLHPWKELYAMDYRDFAKLPRGKEYAQPLVRRWHLGPQGISPSGIFYDQAAATVHFLYHGEGGAYRERLLDYVTSHYTGKKEQVGIQQAFGLSPKELGRKVEAYARQVAEGWRPH